MTNKKKEMNILPKDRNSKLIKAVKSHVWTSKFINTILGAKNDKEAVEWFNNHPEVWKEFDEMERYMLHYIDEVQKNTKKILQREIYKDFINENPLDYMTMKE